MKLVHIGFCEYDVVECRQSSAKQLDENVNVVERHYGPNNKTILTGNS